VIDQRSAAASISRGRVGERAREAIVGVQTISAVEQLLGLVKERARSGCRLGRFAQLISRRGLKTRAHRGDERRQLVGGRRSAGRQFALGPLERAARFVCTSAAKEEPAAHLPQLDPRGLERERMAERQIRPLRFEGSAMRRQRLAEEPPRRRVGWLEPQERLQLARCCFQLLEQKQRARPQPARPAPRPVQRREPRGLAQRRRRIALQFSFGHRELEQQILLDRGLGPGLLRALFTALCLREL
jgi:hypothetical protein